MIASDRIVLTDFAARNLFPERKRGSSILGVSPDEFTTYINTHEPISVLDGYAPFCKLLVYENWTDTRVAAIEITRENEHLLRSAYEARTPQELPVLTRWFEGVEAERAAYLLVIVYDAEQLAKEGDPCDCDWGIVSCLATMAPVETPLAPITMLRNALGPDEGGSGVPLDRESYARSVEFWSKHAGWRPAG